MDKDGALFMVSILLAAISSAAGIWGDDGIMTGISLLALCLTIPAAKYCTGSASRYSLIAATVVLVCTILMVTAASLESLVDGGTVTRHGWIYVAGLIHGAAVIPLIILFYFTTAAAFNASYNWVFAPGFCIFMGLGMMIPAFTIVYWTQRAKMEADIIKSDDVIIGMAVELVMFVVFALFLLYIFRKHRYLITKNGLEATRRTPRK
ncbi:MAG: hypothetical protein LBP82_02635 [Candidatus Methanoplasma sp.]|jgi:hypothetical protein|nr:hypothetical protein [Candidatus Methanoplasma sp.]